MWDKFTVKLWALKHERKYRDKKIMQILIGLSVLVLLLEMCYIAQGGGLSVFGIMALCMFLTVGAYSTIELIRRDG